MSRPKRFLDTSTFELVADSDPQFRRGDPYAILSHRWAGTEVTYQTHNADHLRNPNRAHPNLRPAIEKIRGACSIARQQRMKWLWTDTCCINKSNAVEEGRSINSMFEWYSNAAICYAYLYDVDSRMQLFKSQNADVKTRARLRDIHDPESEWFERGWTLQELLAPQEMEFYDSRWVPMGTKRDLANELHRVTGINKEYLVDKSRIPSASLAARMSWMAGRTTTELEDIAYSMLGIFCVTMTPQYGEGEKAFMRLQRTLMETFPDESIFAWTLPANGLECFRKLVGNPPKWKIPTWGPSRWGMLAPSPDCFRKSGDVIITKTVVPRMGGGYRWIQQGVQFQMSMKSGTEATNFFGVQRKEIEMPLNCWTGSNGSPTVVVQLVRSEEGYQRKELKEILKKPGAKPSTNSVLGIDQVVTRPLTIVQPVYNVPK